MREISGIDFKWLPQNPARIWDRPSGTTLESRSTQVQTRAALLQLSLEALFETDRKNSEHEAEKHHLVSKASLANSHDAANKKRCRSTKEDDSNQKRQPWRRRLIVYNFFALEGYSIAEAVKCASLAVSPCLVPYSPPRQLERRFAAALPQLFARLANSSPGVSSTRKASKFSS